MGRDIFKSTVRRHHNLLAAAGVPPITGPVTKGKGGTTVGKGHGKPAGAAAGFVGSEAAGSGGAWAAIGDPGIYGVTWVATQSGTVDKMFLQGPTSGGSATATYRLCIYAAATASSWGALLGQTGDLTGLAANETKEADLLAPVSIVEGNRYALCVQRNAGNFMALKALEQPNASYYFLADTYADGPPASIGTVSIVAATGAPRMWATS